jgi:hypothetical protein
VQSSLSGKEALHENRTPLALVSGLLNFMLQPIAKKGNGKRIAELASRLDEIPGVIILDRQLEEPHKAPCREIVFG